MPDFSSVVVGSFLGATFGIGTKWIEQWREVTRRRKAVATALLVELHSLDGALRMLRASKRPSRSNLQPTSEFFRKARSGELPELLYFEPQTVYEVMKFAGFVNKAKEVLAATRNDPSSAEKAEYEVRLRASIALSCAGSVKDALIQEGASLPQIRHPRWYTYPELPDIPPQVFPTESGQAEA
jgi:hypothetical protein